MDARGDAVRPLLLLPPFRAQPHYRRPYHKLAQLHTRRREATPWAANHGGMGLLHLFDPCWRM